MKNFFLFALAFVSIVHANSQNVGIGTATPAYKLDVAGRIRVQNSASTAGIYFDGVTLPTRSFIGTLNDSVAGIWGGGGADWNFVMNVENGNIGIGNSAPQYPLNFSNAHGNKISFWNGPGNNYGIGLQSSLLQIHAATVNNDIAFGYGTSEALTETMRIKGNGNVGIGTDAPAYKLDLAGRMRIQHNTTANQTAGLWLDGTTTTARSFIGTIDNDHMGIFGNGGAGWKFSFNVNNGFVGVGTSAPTANLDVNGSIRMRGTFPKKGSIMTSDDGSGNANWSDPVAFKAYGRNQIILTTMPVSSWTKYYYEPVAEYNLGLGYQNATSEFLAQEDGIYHFNAQIKPLTRTFFTMIRLVRRRGVFVSVLAESYTGDAAVNDGSSTRVYTKEDLRISTDVRLLAQDTVWIELYYNPAYVFPVFPFSNFDENTWFSGHLVARF